MSESIRAACDRISALVGQYLATAEADHVNIMEVCGTHTMAIARSGLRTLLPAELALISGPGCPVCVTDQSYIDQAVWLARGGPSGADQTPTLAEAPIIATYGDMVRVPGGGGSLAEARAQGASVEVVYSADNAVQLARRNPDRQVVFLAVGFETTAPGTALAAAKADDDGVTNFSVLTAHKLILPAMHTLLDARDVQVDGFLCPGHVSVILGYEAFAGIAGQYGRPCVVAGFDAAQILAAVAAILEQLVEGVAVAMSVYPSVSPKGNLIALELLGEAFDTVDARWRALGVIPGSGLVLAEELTRFDTTRRFDLPVMESYELPGCRCGDVLCGKCPPRECGLFGGRCTPRDPVGPCMVSSEGACAAAYKFGGVVTDTEVNRETDD